MLAFIAEALGPTSSHVNVGFSRPKPEIVSTPESVTYLALPSVWREETEATCWSSEATSVQALPDGLDDEAP